MTLLFQRDASRERSRLSLELRVLSRALMMLVSMSWYIDKLRSAKSIMHCLVLRVRLLEFAALLLDTLPVGENNCQLGPLVSTRNVLR